MVFIYVYMCLSLFILIPVVCQCTYYTVSHYFPTWHLCCRDLRGIAGNISVGCSVTVTTRGTIICQALQRHGQLRGQMTLVNLRISHASNGRFWSLVKLQSLIFELVGFDSIVVGDQFQASSWLGCYMCCFHLTGRTCHLRFGTEAWENPLGQVQRLDPKRPPLAQLVVTMSMESRHWLHHWVP